MARSHEIDYQIKGESIQIVEVELDPGETVIAEAGAMLFMEDGITFEAKMGDGATPNQGLFDKLLSAGSRIITGESLFLTHFTNQGSRKAKVGFSAPYPGTVIPIDLAQSPGSELIVQNIEYVMNLVGPEHVGLGLDYVIDKQELIEYLESHPDIFPPDKMGNVLSFVEPEQFPEFTELLYQKGYSEEIISGILGGNFLRVAKRVWK